MITRVQQEIIELMKNGWQLASHRSWTDWCSIQKGKQGYGGESKKVSIATIFSLLKKKVIEIDKAEPSTTYYKLADKTAPGRIKMEINEKYIKENSLNLENQYPNKIKDWTWLFKIMNNKKGVFLRNNKEIQKSIRVYNDLINTFDFLVTELRSSLKKECKR